MADGHLAKVAELMADLDLCTLVTRRGDTLTGRPMSNNGEVGYGGDSWFFTRESAGMVADIEADPRVALTFQRSPAEGAPIFVHVQARAELIRDRGTFEAHWSPGLKRWFEDGVETEGLVMIRAAATRIAYWDGGDEGDFAVGE